MGVLDLFVVALMPVLKVLLVTAVGSLLAMERVNLLGRDAKQHVNNMVHASEHSSHIHYWLSARLGTDKAHKNSPASPKPCHRLLCSRKLGKLALDYTSCCLH